LSASRDATADGSGGTAGAGAGWRRSPGTEAAGTRTWHRPSWPA